MRLSNPLRNISWIYRFARSLRRCVLPAISTAFWWFYQTLAFTLVRHLYSTDLFRRQSFLYSFLMDLRNGPPFHFFSVYQSLRCGWPPLEGRIILEDQGSPKVSSSSLLATGHIQTHTHQPHPIFWSRHANAHLVSSSLALLTPQKELALESVYGYSTLTEEPAVRYLRLPPPVRLPGNWTSLVSRWVPNDECVPNHSHWLLDALPRLALLPEFPADTRVIVPPKLAAYQRESLAMLGLDADRLRPSPETHLEIEDYYFSAPPSMIACYSPYAVKFLREKFLPRADTGYHGPKRFFITRRNNNRTVANALQLEQFFLDLGWGVVDLCDLTFAQEIQLFAEAEAVCGMMGSGTTNLVFSQPGCVVVSLMHDYWTDSVLEWIIQTVGIEKYSVHVYPSDACRRWHVDLDVLRRQLQSVGLLYGKAETHKTESRN